MFRRLLSRRALESMRNLRLPRHAIFAEDLRGDFEIFGAFEQTGADDDLVVTHNGLMVVYVGGAVGAVVAVNGFAFCSKRNIMEMSGTIAHVLEGNGNKDRWMDAVSD